MSQRDLLAVLMVALSACAPPESDGLAPFAQGRSALLTQGWTLLPAGPLPRSTPVMALLKTGDVLVAGGVEANATSSNAMHLFHPATGAWETLAPSSIAYGLSNGTMLLDGRALLVTGDAPELYDPATKALSLLPPAPTYHGDSAARRLPDGRVILLGGGASEAEVDAFDPATGSWATLAPSPAIHSSGGVCSLTNGRVFIVQGASDRAERYDHATNSWFTAPALATSRINNTCTVLADGRPISVGGVTAGISLTEAFVFEPDGDAWSVGSSLLAGREDHLAALLPNGALLVASGYFRNTFGFQTALVSTELRDPVTGVFSPGPSMNGPHCHGGTMLLPSGQLLVVGGSVGIGCFDLSTVTANIEVFERRNDDWTAAASAPVPSARANAVVLSDGDVLVVGGEDAGGALAAGWRFSFALQTWSTLPAPNVARANAQGVLLADGRALVCGGTSAGGSLASCELFDPDSGTFSSAPSMATARDNFRMLALPDGRVLAVGGTDGAATLGSVELYRPASDSWSPAAPLATAREGFAAALLGDGTVLVVGGVAAGGSPTASVERYVPATDAWTPASPLNPARADASAVLLPSGQLLVLGGVDASGVALASAAAYDAAADAWQAVADLTSRRAQAKAVVLPNGKALVSGGWDGASAVASAELFDPMLQQWLPATAPLAARADAAAALLPSGRWLVLGGRASAGGAPSSAAEVYDEGREAHLLRIPTLDPLSLRVAPGAAVAFSGTRFNGSGDSGSGNTSDDSPDHPLVQLVRPDDGSFVFAPVSNWTQKTGTLTVPASTPEGWYRARVVVAGVPSQEERLLVTSTDAASCNVSTQCSSGFCALDGCCPVPCDGTCGTGVCVPLRPWRFQVGCACGAVEGDLSLLGLALVALRARRPSRSLGRAAAGVAADVAFTGPRPAPAFSLLYRHLRGHFRKR